MSLDHSVDQFLYCLFFYDLQQIWKTALIIHFIAALKKSCCQTSPAPVFSLNKIYFLTSRFVEFHVLAPVLSDCPGLISSVCVILSDCEILPPTFLALRILFTEKKSKDFNFVILKQICF